MYVKIMGIGVDFGNYHVYPGDEIACGNCDYSFIASNDLPVHDKGYKSHKYYRVAAEAFHKEIYYGKPKRDTRDPEEQRMDAEDIADEIYKSKHGKYKGEDPNA